VEQVLITGARGLLGTALVPFLIKRGHAVVSHGGRSSAGSRSDLTVRTSVLELLAETRPTVVINLAALTNVDTCEKQPNLAYMTNVRIVENIAEWIAKERGRCRLVQISTDQVYDGAGPHPEVDVTLTNYYAFSKYAAELSALAVGATVVRTNFTGPSSAAGRLSLSDWIVQSLRRGAAITVFDDILFSPLTIGSLVRAIERCVTTPLPGVYNMGSRHGMSKADFAFELAARLGLPTSSMRRGPSVSVPMAAYRPKDMRMDSSAVEAALGFKLPSLAEEITSLQEAYASEA